MSPVTGYSRLRPYLSSLSGMAVAVSGRIVEEFGKPGEPAAWVGEAEHTVPDRCGSPLAQHGGGELHVLGYDIGRGERRLGSPGCMHVAGFQMAAVDRPDADVRPAPQRKTGGVTLGFVDL